jgi:hypothetical protein
MSKLEVDTIAPQSGTQVTLGESGDTVTIPTGVTLDASNATTTLPANVVTTDGTQTLTNKSIAVTQLTGTVATSNLGTGTADATTFLRGDQTYASATPAADSITTTQLAYNPNSFRNIIINGDMSIAQRGTSESGLTNGSSGYYTIDRWRYVENGSTTSQFTMSQDTDVPTGQGFAKSLKMDCTTAQNPIGSSDAIYMEQKFEGQNLQYLKKGTSSAESLTVSFWVKSNKTGDFGIALYDNDNGRIIGSVYTINSANTWEKKTVTFAGDTTGAFDNDNGHSLSVWFHLDAGADRKSADNTSWGASSSTKQAYGQTVNLADDTANEWYITGVQLEAGTTASDFEFLPYDVNLQRCERYYHKNLANVAYWPTVSSNNSYRQGFYKFPSTMRATPTVSSVTFDAAGTTGSQFESVFGVNTYINLGNSTSVSIFQGLIANAEL